MNKKKLQQATRQAVIMSYTARKYSELITIATDDSRTAEDRTRAMFKAVRGHARIDPAGSGYISADGYVIDFTLFKLIDTRREPDTAEDLIFLAEDLTQAYYTTAGGRKPRNTPALINAILGPASPYYNS